MVTRVLKSPDHIPALATFIAARNQFPLTVTIVKGDNRSQRQNRLAFRWYQDISRQLGDTSVEDVRADCKVSFGVPVLRAENEAFRQDWDRTIGQLDFERQRRAVKSFDLPVTRLMTVKQMSAFLDAMGSHWLSVGFRLTDPEALKYEEEFV